MTLPSLPVARSNAGVSPKKHRPSAKQGATPTRRPAKSCCRAAAPTSTQSGQEQTLHFEYFEGVSGWFKTPYVEANLPEVSSSDIEDFLPLRRMRTFLDAVHDRDSYMGSMGSMDRQSFDWGDLPADQSPHDTVDLNDVPMQHARRLYDGIF